MHEAGRIVAKFGGSNLRERDDLGRIVRIVRSYGGPLVIVVSALYGITNKLVGARRVEALSYRAAAELSYFGARILHPRTVEPLEDLGIRIRIMDVEGFDGRIEPSSVIGGPTVPVAVGRGMTSVTYSDDVAILRLRGPGVGVKPGILAGVTTSLDTHGVNIKSIITAQTSINLLLPRVDLERSHEIVKGLGFGVVREVVPVSGVSLVAVVGECLAERQDLLSSVMAGLARADVHVLLSATGASEVAAYYIVGAAERSRAVQAIHDELFGRRGAATEAPGLPATGEGPS